MNTKKAILLGILIVSFIAYDVLRFKVGPCSPELEILINGKR